MTIMSAGAALLAGRSHAKQERRIALHEAAHAVAAHVALGVDLTRVELTVTENGTAGEYSAFGPKLERAIVLLAGAAALRRAGDANWREGSGYDFRRARELIAEEYSDRVDQVFGYAERIARVIARDHWRAIKAVAGLLLERRKLSGEEMRKILDGV
jgi:ATP-dependent Zn protease